MYNFLIHVIILVRASRIFFLPLDSVQLWLQFVEAFHAEVQRSFHVIEG